MFALRSWLRTPRLALTLLACIAVSIGGTATVFTFAARTDPMTALRAELLCSTNSASLFAA